MRAVRRVLMSVSDKEGLPRLGGFLHSHGAQILSTGGTATALRAAGVKVWGAIVWAVWCECARSPCLLYDHLPAPTHLLRLL
jgi:hypothetical protein